MVLKVGYDCKVCKQEPGSLHCGYYMCEHLRMAQVYKVNREDVSHHILFFESLLCLIVLAILVFSLTTNSFPLQQTPNYEKEWEYLFTRDMKDYGIDHLISDMCTFLRREIFHISGQFFDKEGSLAEFPHLINYERFGI